MADIEVTIVHTMTEAELVHYEYLKKFVANFSHFQNCWLLDAWWQGQTDRCRAMMDVLIDENNRISRWEVEHV